MENSTESLESVIHVAKKINVYDPIEHGRVITMSYGGKSHDYKILNKAGEGGFGSVFRCSSNTGEIYAIKRVANKGRGIPCLMEASVMSTYKHQYLNRCIAINSTSQGIYVLQDMAEYDLHTWRRKTDNPSDIQIRNFTYKMLLALEFLHRQGIVHGDVKPSNCLFFTEDDIRLSDFNLSTYVKWESDIHLCTCTYRPQELWRGKPWDKKIDVWAFGCTLFELKYGKGLFRYQGDDTYHKQRYMNAILDWGEATGQLKGNKRHKLRYNAPRIPKQLTGDPILLLIIKCLQVYPLDRPSISTIISDPFYAPCRKTDIIPGAVDGSISRTLDRNFRETVKKSLVTFVDPADTLLLEVATNICAEFIKKKCYDNFLIKKVCVWIAKKLIRKGIKEQQIPNADKRYTEKQILEVELDICDALGYKLH